MDTAPIRKLWWLAGDGTVNQLPWYYPGECIRRVCSRWLREIDICELQGCWSAAPALCGRGASGRLCAAVEPTRGRISTLLGLGRAHLIHLPALGAQDRMAAPVVAVRCPLIALTGVSKRLSQARQLKTQHLKIPPKPTLTLPKNNTKLIKNHQNY